MKYENVSKHEAIMKAKQLLGVNTNNQTPEALFRTAVLTKIFNSFRNGMQRSQAGRQYAESRGLDPERLEIGYNSGQFHHNGKVSDNLMKSFVKYGILKPGVKGGYQVFGKGGICFALRNHQGQVTGLYFRSIFENNGDASQGSACGIPQSGNPGTGIIPQARHFYLKDRQGLYPGYPSENTRTLILTEAIIDAATLLQLDDITRKYSILALYGTNGLTEEHRQAIRELDQLQEIILFFDGDQAGREAIKKHAETLQALKEGIRITYINTPDEEDVNSLYVSHEKEIFTHLLETRKSALPAEGDYFLSIEKKKEPFIKAPENRLNTSNPEYIIYQARGIAVYPAWRS